MSWLDALPSLGMRRFLALGKLATSPTPLQPLPRDLTSPRYRGPGMQIVDDEGHRDRTEFINVCRGLPLPPRASIKMHGAKKIFPAM